MKGNPEATTEARHLAEDITLAESKLERLQAEANGTRAAINDLAGGYTSKFEQLRAVLGNIGGKLKTGIAAGLTKSKLAAAALLPSCAASARAAKT